MDSLWLIGYVFLAAGAVVQALLVAINVFEHRRRALVRLKRISYSAPAGRVLVLSPCKGHERNLEENLRAVLTQDYPDYEVTFIVEDANDSACPVIRRAMAACPQTAASLLVAGLAQGCGQKVHNLRMATAEVAPEIRHLAFFDSDSRPKSYWVRAAIYKHCLPLVRINSQSTRNGRRQIGATTGYRWLVPLQPTLPNHLVAAINCNVMAVLGRSSHHMVWGGSWAIRRETFEQLKIREAWAGTLSDDLVASNCLRRAELNVRFDPACVLTAPVDFDWSGMFDFVVRQYRITRYYAFRWWLLALAAATVGNLAWFASLGLLAGAMLADRTIAWLPATALGALYGLGLYRGWAMQSLAAVYSGAEKVSGAEQVSAAFCAKHPKGRSGKKWPTPVPHPGVRQWQVWGSPAVAFVQWLGLIASAFGNRVTWRSIDYRLGKNGRVLFQRILAAAEVAADETEHLDRCPKPIPRKSQFSNLKSE